MLTYFNLALPKSCKDPQELTKVLLEEMNSMNSVTAATYLIAEHPDKYEATIVLEMEGKIAEYQHIINVCRNVYDFTCNDESEINDALGTILLDMQLNQQHCIYVRDLWLHGSKIQREEKDLHDMGLTGVANIDKTNTRQTLDNIAGINKQKNLNVYSEGVEITNKYLLKCQGKFNALQIDTTNVTQWSKEDLNPQYSHLCLGWSFHYLNLDKDKVKLNPIYYNEYIIHGNLHSPLNEESYDSFSADFSKCLYVITPIVTAKNAEIKSVIVLDGSIFKYDKDNVSDCNISGITTIPINNQIEGTTNSEDVINSRYYITLEQLQCIHAALHTYNETVPTNDIPVFSAYVERSEDSKKKYLKRLENALKCNRGNMLIIDYEIDDDEHDITRDKRFISLIEKYKNSVQIVFTCQPSMIDFDEPSPSNYSELIRTLKENNISINALPENIADAELCDLETFYKKLRRQDYPAKSAEDVLSLYKEWRAADNNPSLLEFLHRKGYLKESEKMAKNIFSEYETLKGNPTIRDELKYKITKLWTDIWKSIPENNFELLTKDFGSEIERLGKEFQPELNEQAKYISAISDRGISEKPHIAICGNTGSGKTLSAKLLANFLIQKHVVTNKKPKVYSASSFIGQFQGQTTANVIDAFRGMTGSACIIEGIDTLLHQADYGNQALDEIGVQLENCSDNTVIIITCEENALTKILSSFPKIGSKIGRVIHLNDYNEEQINKIIKRKLWEKGLTIDSLQKDYTPAIQEAFRKLEKTFYEKQALNTNGLRFNLTSDVTFDDIKGNETAKYELMQIVKHLNSNDGYTIPKGILLEGAPGTGKTLLAKAFANEAKIPFCNASVSYFTDYKADGAERVQTLFAEARKRGKCVIFIDEIESIVPSRERTGHSTPMLSQLLAELDGFANNSGIIVLAATNHMEQIDEAILRAGRFDRKIHISLPNKDILKDLFKMYISKATKAIVHTEEPIPDTYDECLKRYIRIVAGGESKGSNVNIGLLLNNGQFAEDVANAIFENYCLMKKDPTCFAAIDSKEDVDTNDKNKISCSEDVTDEVLFELAELTTGCASATIKAIVDKAVNTAIIENSPLSSTHLKDAVACLAETTVRIMSKEEKKRTAYHELGHTTIALLNNKFVPKVSIIPKDDYLGYTQIVDTSAYYTKETLLNEVAVLVAGRAMEEIIYGKNRVSCGCASDMQTASRILFEMLTTYGFSDEIGMLPFDFDSCTDFTKHQVYSQGDAILKQIYSETKETLSKYKDRIENMAVILVEEQELFDDEFIKTGLLN